MNQDTEKLIYLIRNIFVSKVVNLTLKFVNSQLKNESDIDIDECIRNFSIEIMSAYNESVSEEFRLCYRNIEKRLKAPDSSPND